MGTTVNITSGGKAQQTRISVTPEGDLLEQNIVVNAGGDGEDLPQATLPKKDNCCEHCFGLFERAGNYTVGVFKDGLEEGKKCANPKCNCGGHSSNNGNHAAQTNNSNDGWRWWNMIPMLIAAAIMIWLVVNQKGCAGVVDNETPCCLDEYKQGEDRAIQLMKEMSSIPQGDGMNEGEGYDPDPPSHTTPTTYADVDQYGIYKVADPDLTLSILAHLSGKEWHNFRKFHGDSLDGENKFVLLAAEVATFMASGLTVDYRNGEPQIRPAIYTVNNRLHQAGPMAWEIGERAKYGTGYQNEKSFNWWANSAVQAVPSSGETDFSRAVDETIERLMEKVHEEQIPSLNGRVIFAVNHTSNASGAKSTTRKESSSRSPPPPALAHKGAYVSPLRPEDINEYVRGVKPKVGKERPHHGHDLSANEGTPIFSTSGGRVIEKGYQVKKKTGKGYGNYLVIYDGKYVWRYAHMKSRSVRKGDVVRKGQQIGTVGDTGSPGAFHLHIECWTLSEWNKKEAGKDATPISEQLWQ